MTKFNDSDGVWRTIGGRRVFIKDGQSLSDAMKESGKFKSAKKKTVVDDEKLKKESEKLDAKRAELWQKYAGDKKIDKEKYDEEYKKATDDYYKATKEVEKEEETTNDYMNDKIRKSASKSKDDLPKRTEIKEQGTSNRKEVSENIQAHILDYYTPDYTGDDDVSAQDAFIRQMEAMGESNMWNAGKRIAEGGSYLIYNGDMADFLNELKINPKGKTFSEDKAFDMYTSLIGRESAKLYDRLKKNAYKAYLKEHPNSNMSFEDFKDMRK